MAITAKRWEDMLAIGVVHDSHGWVDGCAIPYFYTLFLPQERAVLSFKRRNAIKLLLSLGLSSLPLQSVMLTLIL